MVCRPASQFCCGCSVSFGVKGIIFLHLLFNLFFVVLAWIHIAMRNDMLVLGLFKQMGNEVLMAGFCLAGLPLCCLGLWGALQRRETLVQLYRHYLGFCIAIDVGFFLLDYIFTNPCEHMPAVMQGGVNTSAFACGVMRVAYAAETLLLIGIQMYFYHVVWSYCEDLAEGGGADLGDILVDSFGRPLTSEALRKRRMNEDIMDSIHGGYHSVIGLEGTASSTETGVFGEFAYMLGLVKAPLPSGAGEYGTVYDGAAASGLGGNARIFKGNYHEMQYPPPSRHVP